MANKSLLPDKIAFVDIETSGTSFNYDSIIEIGIIRVENNQIIESFHTLFDTGHNIPPEISKLTGITQKDLDRAPSFYEIKDRIYDLLSDCIFCAHNVRFDYGFIKKAFKKYQIDFQAKQLCSAKLSKKLFPAFPHHNLDSIIQRHQINCPKRHRAFDDARVIFDFYQKLQTIFPEELFSLAVSELLRQPSIPINLNKEMLQNIPESPGVYVFYDKNGVPLYVGKSLHLKNRVMSHFAADYLSSQEMNIAAQVSYIETIPTAGELGALIKESQMINKYLPVYNRRSRYAYQITILKYSQTEYGYLTLSIVDVPEIELESLSQVAGMFKSRRQAKDFLVEISKEFELCSKLLQLEKAKNECFGYQLGSCKGACLQKEDLQEYNKRLMKALDTTRIKPWPFDKSILITEKDSQNGLEESFLFNQWAYLGQITTDGENVKYTKEIPIFNREIYQILNSYLKKTKPSRIKLIDDNELEGFFQI